MKIYTGNFANVKKYLNVGLYPISIALSARYFSGTTFRILNPDREYMHEPEKTYTPKYESKLSKLNAKQIYGQLLSISNNKDIVLLCHESEYDFCHRHLVAKWLKKELGIEVKELGKMQMVEQIAMF